MTWEYYFICEVHMPTTAEQIRLIQNLNDP